MKEINEPEVKPLEDDTTLNPLQKIINSLKEELQTKDTLLTNVTKEKDRLLSDMKKIRRANNNLKQQLEDERAFYLKEKEYYCKEMTVTKKYRKEQKEELKNAEVLDQIKEIENLKKETSKLKLVLNDTLEANYNLSIKFLRMKNTKYSLKARLKREQTENAKIISDLSKKLEHSKDEINHIISDKFRLPIPPSNKKYLQVVKQNTQLIHGNLNYQVQISKLYNDIERIKAEKIKNETSLRLQYSRKLKAESLESKESSDKISDANLCDDSKKSIITVIETKGKPSDSTISSSGKEFNSYSDTQILRQKEAIRTQSAPEFRINEEVVTEDNEFPYENT